MRRLSQIMLLLVLSVNLFGQSPHGEELTIACEDCHNPKGWKLEAGTYSFTHDQTGYPLEGMHQGVSCKNCHPTLVFSQAENDCMSCHTDMHAQTVGMECARCHTPKSWIVENITDIHQQSRFPLVGPHYTADCFECHPSASLLQFQPLGIDCFDCHQQDYASTTQPNHIEGNFSTDCAECHSINAFSWSGTGFNHAIFPLTAGHAINDCKQCHTGNDYSDISNECFSCHQADYTATANPGHLAADIGTDCAECHTTNPDWKPAQFIQHDAQYFPIYSGKHGGEWNSCTECHLNASSYASFTCIDCHEHNQPDMDDEHEGVNGYAYNSIACLECHPTGDAEGSFNHSATNFPLTGAHVDSDCEECHPQIYEGTSTFCYDCHTPEYNQSTNPNHNEIGIANVCDDCHTTEPGWIPASFNNHDEYYPLTGAHTAGDVDCFACHEGNYTATPNECAGCHTNNYNETTNPNHIELAIEMTCEDCHTTNPGWTPATFEVHNEYYPLTGAHVSIPSCFDCHEGSYSNTPNECYGCHADDYNQTNDPPHQSAQFPTDCEQCHTTSVWDPSTFNHDGQYFPIYSGEHQGEWNFCSDCHENPSNYAIFTCITCHEQGDMEEEHQGISGYQYNSIACLSCHPDGSSSGAFNHGATNFPLTGAHTTVDCNDCHENGYTGTSTICADCHGDDFNQTTNPNHTEVGISGACDDCHTTNPDWTPATFEVHNEYFPLTGAHLTMTSCFDCHEGNYTNTPNECAGCHTNNYNQTTNPNHTEVGISMLCEDCHTSDPGWTPAAFEVHNEYYPLTGAHASQPSCFDCHEGSYTNTPNECYGCHADDYNQTNDPPHQSAQFPVDCEQCHTTSVWDPSTFNHDGQYFPIYSGEHQGEWDLCSDCHENASNYAIFTCITCHEQGDMDDEHQGISGYQYNSIACLSCHPDGSSSGAFNHSTTNFPLTGAHTTIDCNDCHESGYAGTSTICSDCHLDNFNQTTNPNHTEVGISNTCEDCHTTDPGWTPASFDVHNEYFPLTGAHLNMPSCLDCHEGNYTNTPNECAGCHTNNYNQTTNPNHNEAGISMVCEDCHTTDPDWTPATFEVHNEYFPLTGAHLNMPSCFDCHEGNYSNTPNECAGCHTNNYNQTTNPNHNEAGISMVCEDCHTSDPGWIPATFEVHNEYYPLTGAHASIPSCFDCHEGNYSNTPNECYGCHADDYNQTNNPPHQSAQFPIDCEQCHTTSVWDPSTFDHDGQYFPIYSGKHQGEWNQCSDCHDNPSNYAIFNCLNCHQEGETNADHSEVTGYQYNSIACLSCHPNGNSDQRMFKKF